MRAGGKGDLGRLPAAQVEDQRGRGLDRGHERERIDAALEPGAGVGRDHVALPGAGDGAGVEPGAFEQDVGGRFGHPGIGAADDTPEAEHHPVVGNHAIRRGDVIALVVERLEALAFGPAPGNDAAVKLRRVIDVQRAGAVEREEIGDVDQGRDRSKPDGAQALLQPGGALAVGKPTDPAASEGRAAAVRRDRDRDVIGKGGRHRRFPKRLQRSKAGGGEVARNAAHTKAIGAVGGDGDVEQWVVMAGVGGEGLADRGIGGQFDDSLVALAELEFALRTHHAIALDPADGGDLEGHIGPGNEGAGRSEHALHPGPSVGRAADDLHGALPGVDLQDLQLVGLGVGRGAQHLDHDERGELFRRIGDALDLEAE